MAFQPTDEQAAVLDAFATGNNLVIEAGAGAGKTSTLKLAAHAAPRRRGIYFAFNKKIADEARRSFPVSVKCSTLHSLAYRAVMNPARQAKMNGPRQNGYAVAKILGVTGPLRVSTDRVLAPQQVARMVMETVTKFCQTDAEQITRAHVPFQPGIEDAAARARLAEFLVPIARKAWADLTNPNGQLKYSHDHYLKEWALTHPQLGADYVLLDEAQDSNGLTIGLVRDQRDTQVITVGDSCQSIYGWRGATNGMQEFGGTRLFLTQSFRFGPAVAAEANKWLELLDADLRIVGTPTIPSVLGDLTVNAHPDAILCRTNAEAVTRVMDLQANNVPVALLGGGQQMEQFANGARDLKDTGRSWHHDLAAFATWGQLQDYCDNDHGGSDLAVAVRLIDTYGPEAVIDAMRNLTEESRAQVVVSTAHKAKGAEWDRVRIAEDFAESKPDDNGDVKPNRDECMLAYVSVTRAKRVLDRGSLAWVDRVLAEHRGGIPVQGQPEPAPAPPHLLLDRIDYGDRMAGAPHPEAKKPVPAWSEDPLGVIPA